MHRGVEQAGTTIVIKVFNFAVSLLIKACMDCQSMQNNYVIPLTIVTDQCGRAWLIAVNAYLADDGCLVGSASIGYLVSLASSSVHDGRDLNSGLSMRTALFG